jgi:hypothetical protein
MNRSDTRKDISPDKKVGSLRRMETRGRTIIKPKELNINAMQQNLDAPDDLEPFTNKEELVFVSKLIQGQGGRKPSNIF